MKYTVTIRGQKADYQTTIECDEIEFKGSWWAVCLRWLYDPGATATDSATVVRKIVVAAIPAEHVNLIELVEEP